MSHKRVKDMDRGQQCAVMAKYKRDSTRRSPRSRNITKITPKQSMSVASYPLPRAKIYAINKFKASGKNLYDVVPEFDRNYLLTQKYCQEYAKDIPRNKMPVIEPSDMNELEKKIEGGWIDIFDPYAFGSPHFPKTFRSKKAREGWVLLGQKDGNPTDDVLEAQILRVPAEDLKPLQSQIYLDKITKNIIKFGEPRAGSSVVNTTVIMSKEGYILDGHHRWGQVMITNPKLRMKVMAIPLDIDSLLKVGKSYSSAIGNKPKA